VGIGRFSLAQLGRLRDDVVTMKTWQVVAGAGVGVGVLALLFSRKAAASAPDLEWKATGPMTIKPKRVSPVALTYTGAGDRLTGTDPDLLVVTAPDTATDYAGDPVLGIDDPNAIPLY
jgi:hypothetical protein